MQHTMTIFRLMHPKNMKRHNDNRILSDVLNRQTKNLLKEEVLKLIFLLIMEAAPGFF